MNIHLLLLLSLLLTKGLSGMVVDHFDDDNCDCKSTSQEDK